MDFSKVTHQCCCWGWFKIISNWFQEYTKWFHASSCNLALDGDDFGLNFTVWKNEKFTLSEKKFRQINYLVIPLVKMLLSRNFCQKRVRVKFRNFHTVGSKPLGSVWPNIFAKWHGKSLLEKKQLLSNLCHLLCSS